jgi:poly-gamma-glutamate synthesis protein (capsule biosynthesis protein)
VLAYLPTLARVTDCLIRFGMVPLCIRRFRLTRASAEEAAWLAARLTREDAPGTSVDVTPEGALTLAW